VNLEEIRGRKARMEDDIQQIVTKLVDDFTLMTGVRVEGITIPMIDVTSLGDGRPVYLIGKVEVTVERI